MEGWISLHRKLKENWVWECSKNEPASNGQAWVDLLLRANHKPGKFVTEKIVINIPRGSFFTSASKLANDWGWTVKKVRVFISKLKTDGMIEFKSFPNVGTQITINNFNSYQLSGEHLGNGRGHQGNLSNNDNNDNNISHTQGEKNCFGEFKRVLLTGQEYQDFIGRCMSTQLADQLIKEFDINLQSGVDATRPEGHLARLCSYLNNYRKKPIGKEYKNEQNSESTGQKKSGWTLNPDE